MSSPRCARAECGSRISFFTNLFSASAICDGDEREFGELLGETEFPVVVLASTFNRVEVMHVCFARIGKMERRVYVSDGGGGEGFPLSQATKDTGMEYYCEMGCRLGFLLANLRSVPLRGR